MTNEIKELRKELDLLDDKISDLISERVKTARKIVEIKGRNDMPKDDFSRESAILNRISELPNRFPSRRIPKVRPGSA